MRHLSASRQIAFIYRNLSLQQKCTLPVVSCNTPSRLLATFFQQKSTTTSQRSSKWVPTGPQRSFHSSPGTPSKLLYEDNILRSPHPEVDIPSDVAVHELIFEACDKYKDCVALDEYATGRKYTYAELKQTTIKLANSLHDLGLRKGDVILSYTTNTVDITFLMLACSSLGIWFSAANPLYSSAELARHVEHSESIALFVGEDLAEKSKDVIDQPNLKDQIKHAYVFGQAADFKAFSDLLEHPSTELPHVELNPKDDVHVLPYSSGTTGFPKGVMLTHRNIVANMKQCLPFAKDGNKRVLCLLPMYHIYGMVTIQYMVLSAGGQLVVLPRFDPIEFLECLQNRKIEVAYLVPPLIVFLSKHPMVDGFDLSSLETVLCGAASLGEKMTDEFLEKIGRNIEIQQGYGLTETSPVVCYDNEFHPGSVGYMLPNTLGKVIDLETEEPVGPDQDGELCVKGPQIMKGYFKNEEATKDMVDPDGWLRTGDIGYYKENGIVYIKDRLKELIKYKGLQVAPAELEALLLTHPAVAEVGVIGVPDEKAGELPRAFVVLREDVTATEEEIVKFVEDNAADYKRLRGGVEFLYELPKLPSGKILRRALKAMLE